MFKVDSFKLSKCKWRLAIPKDEPRPSEQTSNLLVDWPLSSPQDFSMESAVAAQTPPIDAILEQRAAVNFSHTTRVSFFDADEVENEARWYSDSDYASFKISISSTVRAMRKANALGRSISSTKRCIRGVEFACTDENMKKREEDMRAVINAVLVEQERQRIDGTHDVFLIAAVSSTASAEARETACSFGVADANAAYKIHHRTRQDFDTKNQAQSQSLEADNRKRLNIICDALALVKETDPSQYNNDNLGLTVNSSPGRPTPYYSTTTNRHETQCHQEYFDQV